MGRLAAYLDGQHAGDIEVKHAFVRQVIAKADIEEVTRGAVSTMPEGLERRLTEEEFVDLIAFLASLKESRSP